MALRSSPRLTPYGVRGAAETVVVIRHLDSPAYLFHFVLLLLARFSSTSVVSRRGPPEVGTVTSMPRLCSVEPAPAVGMPVPAKSLVARMNFRLALFNWNFLICSTG